MSATTELSEEVSSLFTTANFNKAALDSGKLWKKFAAQIASVAIASMNSSKAALNPTYAVYYQP